MKKFLLFLAAAVATVSCSKEDLSTSNPDADQNGSTTISIAVGANDDADLKSRVDVAESGDDYAVTWNRADELGAWAYTDEGNTSFDKFTIASDDDFDPSTSIFTGSVTNGVDAYGARFVHPYIAESNIAYYVLTLDMSKQESASDLSKMSATTYMMSDWFETLDLGDESIMEFPSMKHLGAAVELKIKCNAAADYTLVSATVEGEMIPTEVAVNLQSEVDADYFIVNKTGVITLTASQTAETTDNGNSVFSLPFNSFPFTIENGASITVSATFKDADGKQYTGSKTIINDGDAINFARATRNKLLFDIAELTEDAPAVELKTIEIVGDDFKGSYADNNGDKAIKGIDLYINQCCKQTGIQMQGGNGYLYNTKPLPGLTTIEIKTISGSVSVYAGKSENPLSDALVASNGVYTIPAGSDYFTIKGGSSLTKLESVKFSYTGIELIETVFTGLDTNSIEFESDATDAVTVNFVGKHFEIASSIEFKNDNEDAFEVVYNNGDSFFTVVPTAANTSDAEYTATIDVTIDGTTHSLAVSQRYVGEPTGGYVIFDPKVFGIADQENIPTPFTLGAITMSHEGGTTARVYNNLGDMRFYKNCTLTFASSAEPITKIEFNTIYSDSEDISADGLNEFVWTGSAESVSFKFYGTVKAESIKVTYGEGGTPEAVFTGLDPESIDFVCDDTPTQTVTILGSNLNRAKSITVDNSNDADFTVEYVSGDTFTVTPNSTNFSSAIFEAIITVTVDGTTHELAVSQKYEGQVEAVEKKVVELTKASMGLGGYAKTDVTVGDFTFGRNELGSFDGKTMQFKSGSGLLYNKTAISGLSKIVITKSGNNNITVYAGSSEQPTSGALEAVVDGGVYTYEITDGSEYVHFDNGSGASNLSSIEIYAK